MHISQVTVRGFRAGASEDMVCSLPGRFTLITGSNNAGKSTICEAIYLAHAHRFPNLRRPSAASLRLAKDGPREIEIKYEFDSDRAMEGPLGNSLLNDGSSEPLWTKSLERSLGKVRVRGADEGTEGLRIVYLPAYRNPVDELARSEAEVLVELLRAQQQQLVGHRNLQSLRSRAEGLLAKLSEDPIVQAVEARVQGVMDDLSGGVEPQHPFIGGQVVDDAFLARVLEVLLSPELDRALGQRLELSGLGYANLLHLAVTIAAIPDLTIAGPHPPTDLAGTAAGEELLASDIQAELDDFSQRSEANEDSFWKDLFHATLIIEEPEAHLHPQLQRGLVRFLQRAVESRPELQVIVTSHASHMISACDPNELVVLRRTNDGRRSFALADLPDPPKKDAERTLRMASLHLDAARSSALFADRLVLVEGITDALLVRQFGRHWAGSDPRKAQFLDALTVVPIGSKVGEWPVHLLASKGFELSTKLAVLTDSDDRKNDEPSPPAWTSDYDSDVFLYTMCHPTLEPSLVTPANSRLLGRALKAAGIPVPTVIDADSIDELFRSKSKGAVSETAGKGAKKKADFTFELATILDSCHYVEVPGPIAQVLDFVFDGFAPADASPILEADQAEQIAEAVDSEGHRLKIEEEENSDSEPEDRAAPKS